MDIIDNTIEDVAALLKLDSVKDKIKKFRSGGLEKGGEYSYENLVFKFLRRNGYIQKLFDNKNELIDKTLSIKENLSDS
jgi:hypothetical protein